MAYHYLFILSFLILYRTLSMTNSKRVQKMFAKIIRNLFLNMIQLTLFSRYKHAYFTAEVLIFCSNLKC